MNKIYSTFDRQMWTNAVLLFRSVTPMPFVRILADLISVFVKLDSLEMEKLAKVKFSVVIFQKSVQYNRGQDNKHSNEINPKVIKLDVPMSFTLGRKTERE